MVTYMPRVANRRSRLGATSFSLGISCNSENSPVHIVHLRDESSFLNNSPQLGSSLEFRTLSEERGLKPDLQYALECPLNRAIFVTQKEKVIQEPMQCNMYNIYRQLSRNVFDSACD